MSLRANKAVCRRVIRPLAVAISLATLLGACGGIKTVEIDIPDEGLNEVVNAAPTGDFAFYVSSDSVPQSAEELQQFALRACTGETVANRAVQIGVGLGIINISGGYGTTECIKKAVETKTLVVTQRANKPPSGVVEIVFK